VIKKTKFKGLQFTCRIDLKLTLIIEDTEKEKKNPKWGSFITHGF